MSKNFFCRRPIPGLPSTPSPASLQHTPAYLPFSGSNNFAPANSTIVRSGPRGMEDIERALAQAGGKITRAAESSAFTAQPCGANVNAFPRRKTDEGSQQRVLGKSGSDGDVWIAIRQSIMIQLAELPGPVIFENLSTLKPNFSARVMRLGENSFGVPFSHQHFSRPPTHSSSIWLIKF